MGIRTVEREIGEVEAAVMARLEGQSAARAASAIHIDVGTAFDGEVMEAVQARLEGQSDARAASAIHIDV